MSKELSRQHQKLGMAQEKSYVFLQGGPGIAENGMGASYEEDGFSCRISGRFGSDFTGPIDRPPPDCIGIS